MEEPKAPSPAGRKQNRSESLPGRLRRFFGATGAEWGSHVMHGSDGSVLVVGRKPGGLETLPDDPSIWSAGIYGEIHAHGRDGERTWWFHVPQAWGDWRALTFGERKRLWLAHERARQEAWHRRLDAREGRVPTGGWENALDRCRSRISILDAVVQGRKDAKLLPLDEFRRWGATCFDEDLRTRYEIEEILQDLQHTRGIEVSSPAAGEFLIHISDHAPAWAAKLAQAAQYQLDALRRRADGDHDSAIRCAREAGRLAAEARAGMWASKRASDAGPTKRDRAHARYRILVGLYAEERSRNEAILQRSSRLPYPDLLREVVRRYMGECRRDPKDRVSPHTVERALRWARESGHSPPPAVP